MKEWDIRGTDEQGIWISFDNRREAEEWINDHTKRFLEHTEREGLHIVECERESIGEKCIRLEKQIEAQQQEIEKLRTRLVSKEPCYTCEISVKNADQIQHLQSENQKLLTMWDDTSNALTAEVAENEHLQAQAEKAREATNLALEAIIPLKDRMLARLAIDYLKQALSFLKAGDST